MLYDDEIRRLVEDAKRDGWTGEALTVRVGHQFDARRKVEDLTALEMEQAVSAFRRIVDAAARETARGTAKEAARPESQAKLF